MQSVTEQFRRQASAAAEVNYRQVVQNVLRWPMLTVSSSDQLVQGVTDIPFYLFNWVLAKALRPESLDQQIELVVDRCRQRGVGMIWSHFPANQPPQLGEALGRHGFQCEGPTPVMARVLAGYQPATKRPDAVAIVAASTSRGLKDASETMHAGFEFPEDTLQPLHLMVSYMAVLESDEGAHFVGYLEGQPAAAGSLVMSGEVAGLYNITTLPAFQRRGIGRALTDRMLGWAAGRGAALAVLESSTMGLPVYQSLGFRQVGEMFYHVWQPEA